MRRPGWGQPYNEVENFSEKKHQKTVAHPKGISNTSISAVEMVQPNFRGHVNPQDRGRAQQWAERLGFRRVVGENIQYGAISPWEAVKQLLTSTVHCENLMDPRWKLFGGTMANDTADTLFPTYWVQVFRTER